ncbi:DUF4287 domain-containing protein [Nocardioides sp. C4-1]|uniref:DUF4287 domain-containing protein n=1 Tax=Nocardioides sp. C4-1 TaxID=3151851 RepID=UPI0032666C30
MSGFQTHLDNAEAKSGVTPQQFIDLAAQRGLSGARFTEVVTWLKADHGLGHGHAANLAQLIAKGQEAIEAKHGALRLDGLAARGA